MLIKGAFNMSDHQKRGSDADTSPDGRSSYDEPFLRSVLPENEATCNDSPHSINDEVQWMRKELHSVIIEFERWWTEGRSLLQQLSPDENDYKTHKSRDVEDVIRNDFAALRSALDEREEELLKQLSELTAEGAKLNHRRSERIQSFIMSLKTLLAKARDALQEDNDTQLLSLGLVILNSATEVSAHADELSTEADLSIDYSLNIRATVKRFLSLGSVTCTNVAPQLSTCCLLSTAVMEQAVIAIGVCLKDQQGAFVSSIEVPGIFSASFSCHASGTSIRYDDVPIASEFEDGTYCLHVAAPCSGDYDVAVMFCGQLVGKAPLKLLVHTKSNMIYGCGGTGVDEFLSPWGVSIGDNEELFVSDSGHSRIQVFDVRNGSYLRTIGQRGTGKEDLHNPRGIYCSSDRKLYVADAGNCRIQVYDQSSGSHIIQLFDRGIGEGLLSGPWGVLEGSDRNIYVSDMNCHNIQVCTQTGVFLWNIGSIGNQPGKFLYPRGICCSSDGLLFVSDPNNHRLQVFNINDGSFVMEISECIPMDVSLGVDGSIYITEFDLGRILMLDGNGMLLKQLCNEGSFINQLIGPCGLCCDPDGLVYVADAGNCRVLAVSAV